MQFKTLRQERYQNFSSRYILCLTENTLHLNYKD